ncbi:MAG TPA: DUF881 domain-containing protein [Acidimicrobiales bacterium]|nr:DUF881 domain-containing protein [Acidimicrobiales bacterium]
MLDRPSLVLAVVAAVLGFLLVTAASTGRAERRAEAPRKTELIRLIESRRSLVDDLDRAVVQLRADVATAQASTSRATAQDRATAARTATLGLQAGTAAVKGRGIVVTLGPSDRTPPSPSEAGAYRIHDTDVQLVVNALFAAGAEAIAVNDSRLVATTPIRAAGDTIIVNFRPLSPPYRVVAIGATRTEYDRSEIASRFRRWTKLFGLEYRVSSASNLTVPGYTGRVAISTAQPVRG